jgi:hypothetical protein
LAEYHAFPWPAPGIESPASWLLSGCVSHPAPPKIDRDTGTTGPSEVVHRFDPPLNLGWPFEARILIDHDGTLTWRTRDRLMTANLGHIGP